MNWAVEGVYLINCRNKKIAGIKNSICEGHYTRTLRVSNMYNMLFIYVKYFWKHKPLTLVAFWVGNWIGKGPQVRESLFYVYPIES